MKRFPKDAGPPLLALVLCVGAYFIGPASKWSLCGASQNSVPTTTSMR